MLLEEGKVITLEEGCEYLILTDIGEVEDKDNKHFYYAIGVTPDDDIDIENIIFFSTIEDEEGLSVEIVEENSELYNELSQLQIVIAASKALPGYAEQLDKIIDDSNE